MAARRDFTLHSTAFSATATATATDGKSSPLQSPVHGTPPSLVSATATATAMLSFLLLVVIVVLINRFFAGQAPKLAGASSPNSNSKSNSTNNSTMVQVIQSEAEFQTAIQASNLVVVDFFATWCGPCKMIAPMLEKFSNDYSNVTFLKVDVDQLPTVASSQEVTSMPTLLFFKSGELVGKVVGANVGAIKQNIDKLA
jgi:thioredoxin 1